LKDEESGTKVVQVVQRDGGQTATSSVYYIIQIQIVLISEIENVYRYVVPYTGKRHNTSQAEIDAFQKYQHEVSDNMT
jgi:hypothetical protein